MNNATTDSNRALLAVGAGIIVLLAVIWTLGMSGVIHLPLPLVWILPFTCLIIGAIAVLWAGGAFESRSR